LETGLANILLFFQAVLVFHGGLLDIFWMLHYVLTGRTLGSLGETNFLMAIVATVFGALLLFVELRLDPFAVALWVDTTIFQLSLSATYILANAILRQLYPKRFRE